MATSLHHRTAHHPINLIPSSGPASQSNTILFLSTPTPTTSTSITSPLFRNDFGLMKAPTPAGVPVMTAVPAGIVVPWLILDKIVAGEKIISPSPMEILTSCLTFPFTRPINLGFSMAEKMAGETRTGPMGANLSKALAKKNWPPASEGSWWRRQERSLPAV